MIVFAVLVNIFCISVLVALGLWILDPDLPPGYEIRLRKGMLGTESYELWKGNKVLASTIVALSTHGSAVRVLKRRANFLEKNGIK